MSTHTLENFVIITNPVSGKGKGEKIAQYAHQRLTAAGRDGCVKHTTQSGDATWLAAEAIEEGVGFLIACGGDGTVHEVVNAIARKPGVVLGILPCGKGNDLANELGIPRQPQRAVEVLLGGITRRVDLGKIGDRYFDTIVGCGYDAEVARRVAEEGSPFSGTAAYVYTALTTLFKYESPMVKLDGDFGSYEGKILLVATGITASYGGGLRIAPNAVMDDGLLDVCIIKPVSRFTVVRMLVTLFWGGHTNHPAVNIHRTKSLRIHAEPPVLLYADGERVGYTPATIEIVKRALTVVVPTYKVRAPYEPELQQSPGAV